MPLAEDQDMISVRGGGSDQALNIWILPGRRGEIGRSRIPIARTRRLKACHTHGAYRAQDFPRLGLAVLQSSREEAGCAKRARNPTFFL
jgi:hypothetical protein